MQDQYVVGFQLWIITTLGEMLIDIHDMAFSGGMHRRADRNREIDGVLRIWRVMGSDSAAAHLPYLDRLPILER